MYRDYTQKCPRDGADLVDARAARGCSECGGLWLGLGDLQVMATKMQQIPAPLELPFGVRAGDPLACPDCKDGMGTYQLYGVEIDRCDKHGIWFDADELARVLMAVWVRSSIP